MKKNLFRRAADLIVSAILITAVAALALGCLGFIARLISASVLFGWHAASIFLGL